MAFDNPIFIFFCREVINQSIHGRNWPKLSQVPTWTNSCCRGVKNPDWTRSHTVQDSCLAVYRTLGTGRGNFSKGYKDIRGIKITSVLDDIF